MYPLWNSYSRMYFKRRSKRREEGNWYKGEKDVNPKTGINLLTVELTVQIVQKIHVNRKSEGYVKRHIKKEISLKYRMFKNLGWLKTVIKEYSSSVNMAIDH